MLVATGCRVRRAHTLNFKGTSTRPKVTRSKSFGGFGKGGHFVRIVVTRGSAYLDTFAY